MREIVLTQNKVTLVDDTDFDAVMSISIAWQAAARGNMWYACCTRKNKLLGKDECILMHRFLLQAKEGDLIDHEDRNGLNNQRSNLRFLPMSLNVHNRVGPRSDNQSGYTGVYYNTRRGVWQAEIKWLGKRTYLGQFNTAEEAYAVRAAKEKELWLQVR